MNVDYKISSDLENWLGGNAELALLTLQNFSAIEQAPNKKIKIGCGKFFPNDIQEARGRTAMFLRTKDTAHIDGQAIAVLEAVRSWLAGCVLVD